MRTIVVCGCFRSGTSIVAQMLDRHPSITLTNELVTFLPTGARPHGNHRLASDLLDGREYILKGAKIDRAAFYKFFCAHGKNLTSEEIVHSFFRFSTGSIEYYGDKYPLYTLQLDDVVVNAMSAKVICCIRDGRDVIESQIRHFHQATQREQGIRREFWMKPNVAACLKVNSWLDYMRAWDDFKGRTQFETHELLFPRMVDDPSDEAIKLARFLDVSPDELIAAFRAHFRPVRHEVWRTRHPGLNEELPDDFKAMLAQYGFEVE